MLNEKQALCEKKIDDGNSLYIGGPGGMGKSYLLNHLKEKHGNTSIFIAPTGISALNIGCSTAHSTFRLKPQLLSKRFHNSPDEKVYELFGEGSPVTSLYFDEISMYRTDLFVTIDKQLRKVRKKNVPFGGLQIVTVGDFYQLSPVLINNERESYEKEYDSLYCFGSTSWSSLNLEYVELTEAMRHSNKDMIDNLQNIRMKREGWQDSLSYFNELGARNQESVFEEDGIFLCTTNKSANLINEHNYNQLEGKEVKFRAQKTGDYVGEPALFELKLKPYIKLLCTANDGELRNGMIVYFVGMDSTFSNMIVVEEATGKEHIVGRYIWKQLDYKVNKNGELITEPLGMYKQFPFKLGYAITVHKSQGCTLPRALIERDSGFFGHGQAYVGFSRIKEPNGVGLMSPLKEKDIIVDKKVTEFYDNGCKGIGLF